MKLYRGVVESNNDPDKLQRVQVRVFGLHTEKNENSTDTFNTIKSADLPWAEVMGGTAFGLISGVGLSSVLRQGTWVWVILHNDNPNKPVVIGTIIGNNVDDPSGKYANGEGFCDPDSVYPKNDRLNRSDIHPNMDARYLNLSILETPSGHIIELDDTTGSESIKVTHKSGSYINITADGNMQFYSSNDIDINATGNIAISGARIDIN